MIALLLVILFNTALLNTVVIESINNTEGLLIVTTFSNLVADIKQITCPNDKVISLVPPGVDPHTYSLRPEDISLLNKADLIISTAHAPFEINIRQLYQKGAIRGTLIEIPKIPGVVLFNNPITQKPNYHMPIYDPFNYMKFLSIVEKKLEELNPSCKNIYKEALYKVFLKEALVLTNTSITNITAVADLPFTQYAVEWLGIHVKYLIVKEQGVQSTPQDLIIIEKNLRERKIKSCIVTSPVVNPASKKLLDLCNKYNIPIL
ncbi:MAG: zinc ABC transporter substrate-binding protein, partial [Staphylothermus sp.]|nr:zinc ABC transporter substrate-binding protein [Staphylothermus sp.]